MSTASLAHVDVSLVGYNNSPTIDQVDPPLTSIAYPGTEVGQAAGSLALQLIARTDRRIPGAVFQPTILVRESTAPPAASPSLRLSGDTAAPSHLFLIEVSDAG